MNFRNDVLTKNRGFEGRSTNINDLINKAKIEEKREKLRTLFFAAALFIILALSAFIISL